MASASQRGQLVLRTFLHLDVRIEAYRAPKNIKNESGVTGVSELRLYANALRLASDLLIQASGS